MSERKEGTSWWQTMPGVLTGIAAVITALGSVIAVIYQGDLVGDKAEPSSKPSTHSKTRNSLPGGPSQNIPANTERQSQGARKPWSAAEAVVLNRDGSTIRLRADTFSNCISVVHDITLETGQTIPFERISNFEVLHADDHAMPNAKAQVRIKLLDGNVLEGTVDASCDLFGYNDIGRFTTYYDRIRNVRFEH